MKLKHLTYSLITFSLALGAGTQAAEAVSLSVVADGLDQPRGFEFGPDGNLYIPEPGVGGNGQCQPSPSTLFQPICAGNTGAITRVTPDGKQERIFNNFESLAEQPSGNQGAGPADIAFDSDGNAYLLTGFAGYPGNRDLETLELGNEYPLPESQLAVFPPSPPDEVLDTPTLAQLYEFDLETGELNSLYDFAEAEIVINPDNGDKVTNPYDLEISGDTAYVVDGGGNSAYSIKLDGSDSDVVGIPDLIVDSEVLNTLPPPPSAEPGAEGEVTQAIGQVAPSELASPEELGMSPEAGGSEGEGMPPEGGAPDLLDLLPGLIEQVPGNPDQIQLQSVSTGAAVGPDGALYVGEYTGFPYPDNSARIHRVGEDGEVEVFAEGFDFITDIQFDEAGNLYVLQFSDVPQNGEDLANLPSSIVQVAPDGTRTTLVAPGEGLISADGINFGPDGSIYVANRAIGPDVGEIVQVVFDEAIAPGAGGSLPAVEPGEAPGAQSVPEPASVLGLVAFGLGAGTLLKGKRKFT